MGPERPKDSNQTKHRKAEDIILSRKHETSVKAVEMLKTQRRSYETETFFGFDVSLQVNVSLYLPGPGETVLLALQGPHILHLHLPANKNATFQSPVSSDITRAFTGWFSRIWPSLLYLRVLFSFCLYVLLQSLHGEILEAIGSVPATHTRLVFEKKKPIPLKLLTPKIVEV